MTEIINTSNASTPLGAYPHARKAGNLLFLSGIGPRSPKDNSIPGLELDANGKDFPVYNKIYAEYFTSVQACRTTVEVKSLPTPIAIELKVIATLE